MIYGWQESDLVCGQGVLSTDKTRTYTVGVDLDGNCMLICYRDSLIVSPIFPTRKQLAEYMNNRGFSPLQVI